MNLKVMECGLHPVVQLRFFLPVFFVLYGIVDWCYYLLRENEGNCKEFMNFGDLDIINCFVRWKRVL